MKRKRDSLISIGDAVSGLDGPVNALRKAAPQALSHFTQADQVDQLVWASEQDPEMGFMARMMALCSLPRTNPGNQLQYKRVNGPYKLVMIAGADNNLPYGTLPRLLMAWVCTEAVRTQSRELVLGSSLSEFHAKAGFTHQRRKQPGRPHPTPKPDEAVVLRSCPVDLRGSGQRAVYFLTDR